MNTGKRDGTDLSEAAKFLDAVLCYLVAMEDAGKRLHDDLDGDVREVTAAERADAEDMARGPDDREWIRARRLYRDVGELLGVMDGLRRWLRDAQDAIVSAMRATPLGVEEARPWQMKEMDGMYEVEMATMRIRVRAEHQREGRMQVRDIADVEVIARYIYRYLDAEQEHFVMLACDQEQQLIGYKVIASGRQDEVDVDARLLFRAALLMGARGIVLIHNHAVSLEPSRADWRLTAKLGCIADELGIVLLEHAIYCDSGQGRCAAMSRRMRDIMPRGR